MEGSPSLPHRARSLGPAPPAPHHTIVVFLPMPPPFSFPCRCRRCTPIRRVLPLLSIAGQLSFSPPGFTSANEPRLRRRLLGPTGSSSPTRSHTIHQPRSHVPLPLRTLSSSSFAAAGTSFEKLELATTGAARDLDHGVATLGPQIESCCLHSPISSSHYDVDLERVSEGYCLPDEDEAALAEVQRLDAAVAGPSSVLASSFEVEILPLASPSGAGPDLAEGGDDTEGGDEAEGAAPPRAMPDFAGVVCLEHACVFRGRRGLNTLLSCYKAAFLFLSFRVSGLVHR
jgi:hypothetical protein